MNEAAGKIRPAKNIICLLLADIIWGVAFVAQRTGGDAVGAYAFNSLRFLIGAVVLIPLILVLDRVHAKESGKNAASDRAQDRETSGGRGSFFQGFRNKRLLIGGIVCGTALAFASGLQQVGITMGASIGKAGFLTACYILMVPILGLFLKKKPSPLIAIGVVMALVGLYLLCVTDGSLTFATSDILLLLSALAFAVQILSIDHFAPGLDSVRLSMVEFTVCGLVSAIPMYFVDMKHSAAGFFAWCGNLDSRAAWVAILYAGIGSSGIAYTLQIVGQKNFNPTIASLIMSLESAFSVLAGWLFLHEQLTAREIAGCAVIFAAVIFAQVSDLLQGRLEKKRRKRR